MDKETQQAPEELSTESELDATLNVASPEEENALRKFASAYDFQEPDDDTASKAEKPEQQTTHEEAEEKTGDKTESAQEPEPARDDRSDLSGVTEDLLFRASQVGLTPSDIARLKTPDAIETAIGYAHQILEHRRQAQSRTESPFSEFLNKDIDKLKKDLIEQGYDETLVDRLVSQERQIQSLASHLERQNDFISRLSQWSQQSYQQQVSQALESQLDQLASRSGDELGDLMSSQDARRQVMLKALAMGAGYQQAGMQPPPLDQLLKEAAYAVAGAKLASRARERVREEVAKSRARETSRPRGEPSSDGAPRGDDAAIRHVANIFRRAGFRRG